MADASPVAGILADASPVVEAGILVAWADVPSFTSRVGVAYMQRMIENIEEVADAHGLLTYMEQAQEAPATVPSLAPRVAPCLDQLRGADPKRSPVASDPSPIVDAVIFIGYVLLFSGILLTMAYALFPYRTTATFVAVAPPGPEKAPHLLGA